MQVKVLEIRDAGTFIPVICVKPIGENEKQRYLLKRDGYRATSDERCVIVIKTHSNKACFDPYDWADRTMKTAHEYIERCWSVLHDGDVIDVEYILGESAFKKISEQQHADGSFDVV